MNEYAVRFVSEEEVVKQPTQRPPGGRNRRAQAWHDAFSQLVENPGQWAEIAESSEVDGASAIMVRIRKNAANWLPNGEFDMRTRRCEISTGRYGSKLYARFVMESDTPTVMHSQRGPGRTT